jgi:hypothetical protein
MSLSALERRPLTAAKWVRSKKARGSGKIGNWSIFERGLHARERGLHPWDRRLCERFQLQERQFDLGPRAVPK